MKEVVSIMEISSRRNERKVGGQVNRRLARTGGDPAEDGDVLRERPWMRWEPTLWVSATA